MFFTCKFKHLSTVVLQTRLHFHRLGTPFKKTKIIIQLTALSWLLLQISCASTEVLHDGKIFYATPPDVGSWLKPQRELVACETILSARYMADLGFFHPQCIQLEAIGLQEYKVLKRSKVQLVEGPMWLLEVQRNDTIYWVPIPWHDWL